MDKENRRLRHNESNKKWRLNHQEYIKKYKMRYSLKNKNKIKEKNREYYLKNIKKISTRNKIWALNNPKKILEKRMRWRLNNLEKDKLISKKWRLKNPNYYIKYRIDNPEKHKNYMKDRKKKDINFNVMCKLRSRLYQAFNNYQKIKKLSSSKYYGIEWDKIVSKLTKELPADYHEKKYHIDHIIPLSSFDFNDKEQIKQAFQPENHQWLLAEENLRKKDNLNWVKINE